MRVSLAIGVLAFAYLSWACSPAWFWLDSGEISAAAIELGVMHPPGAPGLMPIFHFFSGLPIGNLAFRVALGSSFLAAVSIGFQAEILRIHGVRSWVIVLMALGCLGSWTFVRNARVAEIYSFATCLAMVSLWGCCPIGQHARPLSCNLVGLMAAVWAMLGFGDLRLTFGIGFFVYGLRSQCRADAWCAWAPLAVVMASMVLLSIPLSSARHPVSDWGDPDSWQRLWDHLHALSIRVAFSERMWPNSWELWKGYSLCWFELVFQDLGFIAPFAIIVALAFLWRNTLERGLCAWISLIIVVEMFYAIAINPMGIQDRQNSMIMAPLGGLAIGVAVERMLGQGSRFRSKCAFAGVFLTVIFPLVLNNDDAQNTRSWMPHSWTRSAMEQLPPGTLLMSQTDDLSAGLIAARVIEGARPDILFVPAQHLYRKMPDRAKLRQDEQRLWDLAVQGKGDLERLALVLDQWSIAPVALEFPGVLLFAGQDWPSTGGEPPLEIRNQSKQPKAFEKSVEWWLPQLEGAMDRDRLARALDMYARRFRQDIFHSEPLSISKMRRIAWMYSEILRLVDDEHVSSMLNFAVMLMASGQEEQAIEITRRAVKLDPLRVSAIVQLVGFFLGLLKGNKKLDSWLSWQSIDLQRIP